VTDFDLERLGELWREQPDPEEVERQRLAAREVARKARRAELAENVLAALTLLVILAVVSINPGTVSYGLGVLTAFLIVSSQLRQRRFRRAEIVSLTGETPTMLDRAIVRLEATLRRTRFGMLVIGPATAVGAFFALSVDRPGEGTRILTFSQGTASVVIIILSTVVLLATILHLHSTMKKSQAELDRLRELRESYRVEQDAIERS
jgi:Mn2+/Fe2+ NRAMP family transporter